MESATGYRNLCRLITRMNLRADGKGEGRLQWDDLEEFRDGLVALSGGAEGPLAVALAQGGATAARQRLQQLAGRLGPDRLYLELQRHYDREEEQRNQLWLDWAAAERLPLIASNGVRHARRSGRVILDLMTCLRQHVAMDAAGRHLARNSERFLKPAAQMRRLFSDVPQALAGERRAGPAAAVQPRRTGLRVSQRHRAGGRNHDLVAAPADRSRRAPPLPSPARARPSADRA